jgi:hypothetical protein
LLLLGATSAWAQRQPITFTVTGLQNQIDVVTGGANATRKQPDAAGTVTLEPDPSAPMFHRVWLHDCNNVGMTMNPTSVYVLPRGETPPVQQNCENKRGGGLLWNDRLTTVTFNAADLSTTTNLGTLRGRTGFDFGGGIAFTTYSGGDAARTDINREYARVGYQTFDTRAGALGTGVEVNAGYKLKVAPKIAIRPQFQFLYGGSQSITTEGTLTSGPNRADFDLESSISWTEWSLTAGPRVRLQRKLAIEPFAGVAFWSASGTVVGRLLVNGQPADRDDEEFSASGKALTLGVRGTYRLQRRLTLVGTFQTHTTSDFTGGNDTAKWPAKQRIVRAAVGVRMPLSGFF